MKPDPNNVNTRDVLNKAVRNAYSYLNMSQSDLSKITGVSKPQISRLIKNGASCINEGTKEWECALLFIRSMRGLEAIIGEDPSQAHEWLYHYNHHLGGTPIDMLKNIQGLNEVVQYLDAMRGLT